MGTPHIQGIMTCRFIDMPVEEWERNGKILTINSELRLTVPFELTSVWRDENHFILKWHGSHLNLYVSVSVKVNCALQICMYC